MAAFWIATKAWRRPARDRADRIGRALVVPQAVRPMAENPPCTWT